MQTMLAFMMLLRTTTMFHYYTPMVALKMPPSDLQQQMHELTTQIDLLKQQQTIPTIILNQYRNSIKYIYKIYQIKFTNQQPTIQTRISNTGFLVNDELITTNRHITKP